MITPLGLQTQRLRGKSKGFHGLISDPRSSHELYNVSWVGSDRVTRVHISRDGTDRVTLTRPDPREATRPVNCPEKR